VAGLFVFVDLAFFEQALQDSSYDALVTIVRCLRPFIIFNVEFFPEIDKLLCNAFDEVRWRHTGLCG
jgi:hypothetical protein